MCGIAGYLSDSGRPTDTILIRNMCDRIAHRGPDGEGYYCEGPVALGHRRLSIIDVEGGSQPLGNEDGTVQIVFNGEIYNFAELMEDLKKKGHQFKTRSDTEVIVHLYEEVGEDLPRHLCGMFAFAIWDRRRQSLFLARDRFGEKPLYYTRAIPGMGFCFASELKAMTCIPGFPQKVSAASVAEFLNFSYVADPETIYEDVRKLEPGHWLSVSADGRFREGAYWEPQFGIEAQTFEQSSAALEHRAGHAVRSMMVSDVPLGGFLSGGVDSSAVVAYMALQAPGRVKTFSIGFHDKNFDELEYARLVAGKYATEHREEVVTPSIEEMLATLVQHYDEPFGDSSAIPTLYLARMTRRHVTVALSGDGADELFGGYRRYCLSLMVDRARSRMPEWFRRSFVRGAAALYPKFDYLPRVFRAKATLQELSTSLAEAYFNSMSRFRDAGLRQLLSPELQREMGGYSVCRRYCDRFQPYAHLPALLQLQAVDWKTYLPGDILVKVDRATMAYSLESRAPWLDHRLAEMSATWPVDFKVRGITGKVLFRQTVAKHLPEQTVARKKMGFAVPLGEWFRTSLKPVFEESVLQPGMERYLNLDFVKTMWAQHQSGLRSHETSLWNLLMLACWEREHRLKAGSTMV